MPKHRPFIAVDWGTSNRRAYTLAADGSVTDRLADDHGVLSIEAGSFEQELAALRGRLGDLPLLLAGMIGSSRGWIDIPYIDCPADIAALARGVVRRPEAEAVLVPGVKVIDGGRADVMRGEEIQLLGVVAADLLPSDAGACHPGTHAKWIRMSGGSIAAFRTVMTGELFALLKRHSSLSEQLQREAVAGAGFAAGVQQSYERPQLSADLFTVRAGCLLGSIRSEDAASYASGLLIGADLAVGLPFIGGSAEVPLIGDPALTGLYRAALREIGREAVEIDGERAFLEGVRALAERLW